jgi:hypothetical protein
VKKSAAAISVQSLRIRSRSSFRTRSGAGLYAVPVQDGSDCAPGDFVTEIRKGALDPPITPVSALVRHSVDQGVYVITRGRSSRSTLLGASYFCAISFRCRASRVYEVTIIATSARSFRPSPFALDANRQRRSSLNRSLRFQAVRVRLGSPFGGSITCSCSWFFQPASEIMRNRNGSRMRGVDTEPSLSGNRLSRVGSRSF